MSPRAGDIYTRPFRLYCCPARRREFYCYPARAREPRPSSCSDGGASPMPLPIQTVPVFASSTWLDLEPERKAVEAVIQRLRETKFVGMEYFGSRDETTRRASLDEVDRSKLYVGLFAARYGSGITEDEYRRARSRGLPCLIY